jgi:hypothetical protein
LTLPGRHANHGYVPYLGGIRAAALLLYVAGLIGPCLSNCFAPASPAASHECCETTPPGKELRTAGKDCCAVDDQKPVAAAGLHAASSPSMPVPVLVAEGLSLARLPGAIRIAASPPLVLRI